MFEMFHNILLNQHKMTIILDFYVNVIELVHWYHNNRSKFLNYFHNVNGIYRKVR